MEKLEDTKLLKFLPDTLRAVRSRYGLEKPGQMDEAIDILENWLQKQQHFMKKDFPRDYLERVIIAKKGSVERAKVALDKLCTYKTLMPRFYGDFTMDDMSDIKDQFYGCFLPKLTPEHERVVILRFTDCKMDSYSYVLSIARMAIAVAEYIRAHDYNDGYIIVFDHVDTSISELLLKFNPIDARDVVTVLFEGYAGRIKGVHFISKTNFSTIATTIVTQLFTAKANERLHFHDSREALLDFIPKEVLPSDYGGYEKPSKELYNVIQEELTSDEHRNYRREMLKAYTNESLRQTDVFNDQYMGMPGTFRSLKVD